MRKSKGAPCPIPGCEEKFPVLGIACDTHWEMAPYKLRMACWEIKYPGGKVVYPEKERLASEAFQKAAQKVREAILRKVRTTKAIEVATASDGSEDDPFDDLDIEEALGDYRRIDPC